MSHFEAQITLKEHIRCSDISISSILDLQKFENIATVSLFLSS
jgi:hypothetical protein